MDNVKTEVVRPKLIPIQEGLTEAWNFFKQNRVSIWRIQSTPAAIVLLPIAIVFLTATIAWATSDKLKSVTTNLFIPGNGFGLSDILGTNYPLIIALAIAVYIIFAIAAGFFALASYRALFDLCNGTFVSYKDEVRTTLKTLHSVIWVGILVNLITRGGGLLLFIPGIIMSILTKFAFFENFSDPVNSRGLKSVIGSWRITKWYFFPVLGRLIILSLVVGIVLIAPIIICSVLAFSLYKAYIASSVLTMTLIAVLIALIILVLALGAIFVLQPFSLRYQWVIFNELKKIDATVVETPEVKDKVYKKRKIIAIVLAILGLLTVVFNSYSQSSSVDGVFNRGLKSPGVSIIERCDKINNIDSDVDERCKNLLTKADIESIASKSSVAQGEVFTPKDAAYKVNVLNGWTAKETPPDNNPDLNMVVITPESKAGAGNSETYMLIVSGKKPVELKYQTRFVNTNGMPAEFKQKTFLEGVIKGAGTGETTDRNSIYRIEDNVVSMTNMSEGYRDESWVFFTIDDSFLISMTAPADKWNDYRADLYKMALTFTPLPVYSTVK